jgi:chaperonin cofactor prefoldin
MTTVAKLLARKQQLIEALQDDPGPEERDELERQLAQLNEALNELDEAAPVVGDDQ